MYLSLYFDEELKREVCSNLNPDGERDVLKKALQKGEDSVDIQPLFIACKNNENFIFEDIKLKAADISFIDIKYRFPNQDEWKEEVVFDDGKYQEPVEIERRLVVEDLQECIAYSGIFHILESKKFKEL